MHKHRANFFHKEKTRTGASPNTHSKAANQRQTRSQKDSRYKLTDSVGSPWVFASTSSGHKFFQDNFPISFLNPQNHRPTPILPTTTVLWSPVVQSLSHVWFFVTPRTVAHQASLTFTISQSLLKLASIESVMPSKQLILCLWSLSTCNSTQSPTLNHFTLCTRTRDLDKRKHIELFIGLSRTIKLRTTHGGEENMNTTSRPHSDFIIPCSQVLLSLL